MKLLQELLAVRANEKKQLNEDTAHPSFEKLWDKLVPNSGDADTEYGEAVRALGRLEYDYYNNGYGNAVDISVKIEITDNDFDDNLNNLDAIIGHYRSAKVFDSEDAVKVANYSREIQAPTNENNGSVSSEDTLYEAADTAQRAISKLRDMFEGNSKIFNDDEDSDDFGFLPVSTKYDGSFSNDEIEDIFNELETAFGEIGEYVEVEVTENETWYQTELFPVIVKFADDNDAPSNVKKAIKYIRPRVELTGDEDDSSKFFASTKIIKDWLVSLYESKENNQPVLVEGEEKLVSPRQVERFILTIIDEDDEDTGYRLDDALEEFCHRAGGKDYTEEFLSAETVRELLDEADLNHLANEVVAHLFKVSEEKLLENDEIFNGAKVRVKKDSAYYDGDEVYKVSQLDAERGKCWIGDADGRGWYIYTSELELADDSDDEYDDSELEESVDGGDFTAEDIEKIEKAIETLEGIKNQVSQAAGSARRALRDISDIVGPTYLDRAESNWIGSLSRTLRAGSALEITIDSTIEGLKEEI